MIQKRDLRIRRHKRVKKNVSGTQNAPRLSVFRSNKHIYAQIIDDTEGKTLTHIDSKKIKISKTENSKKQSNAYEVGLELAKRAKDKKITKIVFDRGGYKYHGRVKALAEGAREGGLEF